MGSTTKKMLQKCEAVQMALCMGVIIASTKINISKETIFCSYNNNKKKLNATVWARGGGQMNKLFLSGSRTIDSINLTFKKINSN